MWTWFTLLILLVVSSITLITSTRPDDYYPDYTIYHNLERYYHTITSLQSHPMSSMLATWHEIIKSTQDREIYRVTMGVKWEQQHIYRSSSTTHSPLDILLLFGEHAREMISTESALDLITLMHSVYDDDACGEKRESDKDDDDAIQREDDMHRIRFILQHARVDIIPMLNPDGKAHLESTLDYCWRNLGTGVDPNRNTAWEWCGPGASHDTKSEEYCGIHAWSEPESRYIRDIIQGEGPWDAFFSIHSGEKQVFVPFVDTVSRRIRRRRPTTERELDIARHIVEGSSQWFRNYGIAYDKNDYQADGTFMDWVAVEGKVPYSFIVEMWGGPTPDNCFVQFNPPSHQLHTDLKRIRPLYLVGLVALIEDILGPYGIKFMPLPRHDNHELERWRALCRVERTLARWKPKTKS